MDDYKLVVSLLERIRTAFAMFIPETEKEFSVLIQKFQNPETVTNKDRETALNIFREGRAFMQHAPDDIRDELLLYFGLCIARMEIELKG